MMESRRRRVSLKTLRKDWWCGGEREREREVRGKETYYTQTVTTHSKWICLFPRNRSAPHCLPVLQRLGHHKYDEEQVEESDHCGEDDDLSFSMVVGFNVRPQSRADDEAGCESC